MTYINDVYRRVKYYTEHDTLRYEGLYKRPISMGYTCIVMIHNVLDIIVSPSPRDCDRAFAVF